MVFTYGATNGGKTNTKHRSNSNVGTGPRTLDVVFNMFITAGDKLSDPFGVKQKFFSSAQRIDEGNCGLQSDVEEATMKSWDNSKKNNVMIATNITSGLHEHTIDTSSTANS